MSRRTGDDRRKRQANHGGDGTLYANQGTQNVHNGDYFDNGDYRSTHIQQIARARSRAGWWVLAILVVDVGYFFYGKAAYTGVSGDTGDIWRMVAFFVLLSLTGSLIRRWFRVGR
ncbi:hypothetical protein ACGFMK_13445 [Amycolatopsis sp. NPDC049252]|uniref:hypothetical protein n=1 Tax=Amycolatopsis sp. NPDC049252 TaxID=3363933 RepID=UPI00371BFF8A